ncbi:hypothetical protein [Phenylobacterium sp.]|uniref:hypothetical protein n=1 Tax=Phenylobacterium sp. TaxID=1871053 RepID=UPI003D27E664
MAIEGFSIDDEGLGLSQKAVEVADLTVYRGGRTAQSARRIDVEQFKYSIARASIPVRAADTVGTVAKFAVAFRDMIGRLGRARALEVMRFAYITNRPIHADLAAGLARLRDGLGSGDGGQADALADASALTGDDLQALAERLAFLGGTGSLRAIDSDTHRRIAGWGPASDALARNRLLELQRLMREKAGGAGQGDNVVLPVDVLAALGVAHEDELFPAPAAFPPVTDPIVREATGALLDVLATATRPVLVHAVGGMGKTVLLQSVAQALGEQSHVVVFDGFGAGRWRDPSDARHLPERGLLQLANQLAADGLCDPILPGPAETSGLLRTFRGRLAQAVVTLREQGRADGLVLILDAVDQSGMRARDTRTEAFPTLLLESLAITPMDGVRVIASCRTHRRDLAAGQADVEPFGVPPFTRAESDRLVLARVPNADAIEKAAAYGRSGGNPRLLATLLDQGRPFEPPIAGAVGDTDEALDVLLAKQVGEARARAMAVGASREELDALLAGLALLPPPVPVEELAAAQGLTAAAVESFAADLFPLIESTPHGLIFRDEPTETFVRGLATQDVAAQESVLSRLNQRQATSNYAARTYPSVLRDLARTQDLYRLAADERLPATATSGVAQRAIRLARLEAALHVAAMAGDVDQLLRLSLDLAWLAAGHGRSDAYLRDNPDLVAIGDDPEALRRLFEDRRGWSGSRHAGLATLQMLRGDPDEALRETRRSLDWNRWRAALPEDERAEAPRGRGLDVSAPAWVLLRHGRVRGVADWVLSWPADQAHLHSADVVERLEQHARLDPAAASARDRLYRLLSRLPRPPAVLLVSVLDGGTVDPALRLRLLGRLAASTDDLRRVRDAWARPTQDAVEGAVLRCALLALTLGRRDLAAPILDRVALQRPMAHAFQAPITDAGAIVRWLLASVVRAMAAGRDLRLADIAPVEADALVRLVRDRRTDEAYLAAVKAALATPKRRRRPRKRGARQVDDPDGAERIKRLLTIRLPPLRAALGGLAEHLAGGDAEAALTGLLADCGALVSKAEDYPYRDQKRFVAQMLGGVALELVGALPSIAPAAAAGVVDFLSSSAFHHVPKHVGTVRALARLPGGSAAALSLAGIIGEALDLEPGIDTRIGRSAALARALWPLSLAEARSWFAVGLGLADGFSADDMEETEGLLGVARAYSGRPLEPRVLHDFSRICEMQMPEESDRYDWEDYADAFARLGGLDLLPLATRLGDRGHGGITDGHLECLAMLVRAGRLDGELAAGLIGLFEYPAMYRFPLDTFLGHVLPSLGAAAKAELFRLAEVEVDRAHGAAVPEDLARGLADLAAAHLPATDPVRRRLIARRQPDRPQVPAPVVPTVEPEPDPDLAKVLGQTPILTADELDAAALAIGAERRPGRAFVPLIWAAAARHVLPDGQLAFLRAVEQSRVIPLSDKIAGVGEIVGTWAAESAAVRAALPALVLGLARSHPLELGQSGWEASYHRQRLVGMADGAVAPETIVIEALQRLGGKAAVISSTAWLDFAGILARVAAPATIADGLARYVARSAAGLPAAAAGGPWRADLTPPTRQQDVVAGLLWYLLGAPDAATRWRAAHALRRLVELGRTEVLGLLVGFLDRTEATPFQDAGQPFRFLNARLWLLIALARIALDRPDLIAPHQAALEAVAHSTDLPHVLMREIAARALRAVARVLPPADGAALLDRCAQVNASPWPITPPDRRRPSASFYSGPPKGYPERDPAFWFDYDFEKSEITGLATLFGTHKYEAGDRVADQVRRWAPDAKSMFDGAKEDDWGHRPSVKETWVGNLTWHSVFLAAGGFLTSHPLMGDRWGDGHPWTDWSGRALTCRPDGRWLADDTGLTPPDMREELTGGEPPVPRLSRDLIPLLTRGAPPGALIVEGDWNSSDDVDVRVSSAFVPKDSAMDAALALMLADRHDVWIPRQDELDMHWRGDAPWQGWLIEELAGRESALDDTDPYASTAARHNVRPTDAIVTASGLSGDAPFRRRWVDADGRPMAEGLVWGGKSGRGRHETDERGHRLTADRGWIQKICRRDGTTLVVLVYVRRYLREKRGDAAFPSRWLLSTLGADGVTRPILRAPAAARAAVARLAREDRRDLEDRLAAIRAARKPAG